jgi:hypothetical protein
MKPLNQKISVIDPRVVQYLNARYVDVRFVLLGKL